MTKILLVDDMKNFIDLQISFLRRKDCTIFTAHDGLEALKMAKLEHPDIMMLDNEMPKMTGIECARIMKSDPNLKATPIIMISSSEKREEALRAGVDEYLKKPINEKVFMETVKRYVEIKDREESRAEATLEVRYNDGKNEYTAFTRDISTSGISIVAGDLLPVGSQCSIEILSDSGTVKANIEVVREIREELDGHFVTGLGMKFVQISSEDKARLLELIKAAN